MKLTDENRVWHVSTEGDCEGRSVKNFGHFKGNLMEIAKKLSGQQHYALSFREFKLDNYPKDTRLSNVVHINVDRIGEETLTRQLQKEGYQVENSQYYKAVKFAVPADEVELMKREMALNKLTDEEKQLLGLA